MGKPAIFLDRDGVIAESRRGPGGSTPPVSVDDVTIPDGVAPALNTLKDAGYCLVVVTNQPDVARGSMTRDEVDAINAVLCRTLPLDAVYACFHDGSQCKCRKPQPGMLLDAARDLALDLQGSWLIGDRWVDIAAGTAAGVRTILVGRVYSWETTSSGAPPDDLIPDHVVTSVAEAVDLILGSTS
ncbi:MAG: D-glycero-alpha-D-manno-heptose-1,7-bisphosphate 7-phosphatase [Acidimicrobiia bacterium]